MNVLDCVNAILHQFLGGKIAVSLLRNKVACDGDGDGSSDN